MCRSWEWWQPTKAKIFHPLTIEKWTLTTNCFNLKVNLSPLETLNKNITSPMPWLLPCEILSSDAIVGLLSHRNTDKMDRYCFKLLERKQEKKKVKSLSRVRLFATPWTVATRLFRPWDSPGKNTEVGCQFLLQGIFPNQGSNPNLQHWKQML